METKEQTLEFAIRIAKLTQALKRQDLVKCALVNQLIRPGTSIGANVEEANASQIKADFTAKLYIAFKGSARNSLLATATKRHRTH